MEKNLTLVPCNERYWEFVRQLRTDKRNLDGFVNTNPISADQQKEYMSKYNNCYYICLLDNEYPVGFIGEINGDIRVCTDHGWKGMEIGKFMVQELIKINKNVFAKVKINNYNSQKLFESCGFKKKYIIYEPE
jgi:RimJ/RimL family protein N-acetyltransferase